MSYFIKQEQNASRETPDDVLNDVDRFLSDAGVFGSSTTATLTAAAAAAAAAAMDNGDVSNRNMTRSNSMDTPATVRNNMNILAAVTGGDSPPSELPSFAELFEAGTSDSSADDAIITDTLNSQVGPTVAPYLGQQQLISVGAEQGQLPPLQSSVDLTPEGWRMELRRLQEQQFAAMFGVGGAGECCEDGRSAFELVVRSAPERTRVETQMKIVLQMRDRASGELAQGQVQTLFLPNELLARPAASPSERPEGSMELQLRVVMLPPTEEGEQQPIISDEEPLRCERCVPRERRFAAQRGNAVMDTVEAERVRLAVIHSPAEIAFEAAEAVIPVRLTCYTRHHENCEAFVLCFRILSCDTGGVVAEGISTPIIVTDDHKSRIRRQKKDHEANLDSSTASKRRRKQHDSDTSGTETVATATSDSDAPSRGSRALAPRVERVVPEEGPCVGGVDITILGGNFSVASDDRVFFGDAQATGVTAYGPQTILCKLPPAPGNPPQPGLVPVRVVSRRKENFEHETIVQQDDKFIWFRYKDDANERLLSLALEVVNLQVTGSVADAGTIAQRVLNSDAGAATTEAAFPSISNTQGYTMMDTQLECVVLRLLSYATALSTDKRRRAHLMYLLYTQKERGSGRRLLELAILGGFLQVSRFLLDSGLCDLHVAVAPRDVLLHASNNNYSSVLCAFARRWRALSVVNARSTDGIRAAIDAAEMLGDKATAQLLRNLPLEEANGGSGQQVRHCSSLSAQKLAPKCEQKSKNTAAEKAEITLSAAGTTSSLPGPGTSVSGPSTSFDRPSAPMTPFVAREAPAKKLLATADVFIERDPLSKISIASTDGHLPASSVRAPQSAPVSTNAAFAPNCLIIGRRRIWVGAAAVAVVMLGIALTPAAGGEWEDSSGKAASAGRHSAIAPTELRTDSVLGAQPSANPHTGRTSNNIPIVVLPIAVAGIAIAAFFGLVRARSSAHTLGRGRISWPVAGGACSLFALLGLVGVAIVLPPTW